MKFEDVNGDGEWDAGSTTRSRAGPSSFTNNEADAGVQLPTRPTPSAASASTRPRPTAATPSRDLTAGDVLRGRAMPARAGCQTYPTPTTTWARATTTRSPSTSGFSELDNDFGNFKLGTKAGVKFEDVNGNAVRRAATPRQGLDDHAVRGERGKATACSCPARCRRRHRRASTKTEADGKLLLRDAHRGARTSWSSIARRAGSRPTQHRQGPGHVRLLHDHRDSGFSELDNDFGNFKLGTKAGVNFEDVNGDGEWDEGRRPARGLDHRAVEQRRGRRG